MFENLCLLLEATLRAESIFRIMELVDAAILHPRYLLYPPSHIAASALVLVLPVAQYLFDIARVTLAELDECLQWMQNFSQLPYRYKEHCERHKNEPVVQLMERQASHHEALQYILDLNAREAEGVSELDM